MITRNGRPSRITERDYRKPAQRDLDRILYSSAYRRLAGVTQVIPQANTPTLHNRLTHTLRVQQLGRRFSQWLHSSSAISLSGALDLDVVEAACAAHDLGHPPFGHIAEMELQSVLECGDRRIKSKGKKVLLPDSFEGNAQSSRIVTKLSCRSSIGLIPNGLDLTYATLAAILKYPWCKGEAGLRIGPKGSGFSYANKWGAYESERDLMNEALTLAPLGRVRSLEADMMDFADDATYAVHDLEDFFRHGLVPLHSLNAKLNLSSTGSWHPLTADFLKYTANVRRKGSVTPLRLAEDFAGVAGRFPRLPYTGSIENENDLHFFVKFILSGFQESLSVDSEGALRLGGDPLYFSDVEEAGLRAVAGLLKDLTWYFVIDHPALAAVQRGQRHVIRDLVANLYSWLSEADPEAALHSSGPDGVRQLRGLPARLGSYWLVANEDQRSGRSGYDFDQVRLRAVVDYICSLTDDEALTLSGRLGGHSGSDLAYGTWSR